MYYKYVFLFIQKYFIALPPYSKITFTDSYVSIMAFYSITYFRYCTVIILFAHKVILYTKKYNKLQLLRMSFLSKFIVIFFRNMYVKRFQKLFSESTSKFLPQFRNNKKKQKLIVALT